MLKSAGISGVLAGAVAALVVALTSPVWFGFTIISATMLVVVWAVALTATVLGALLGYKSELPKRLENGEHSNTTATN